MNETTVGNWLNELRSGKWEKAEEYLQKDGCFCAMGILCELLQVPKQVYKINGCGPEIALYEFIPFTRNGVSEITLIGSMKKGLQDAVVPGASVTVWNHGNVTITVEADGRINATSFKKTATIQGVIQTLNDVWKLSLSEIADVLEGILDVNAVIEYDSSLTEG